MAQVLKSIALAEKKGGVLRINVNVRGDQSSAIGPLSGPRLKANIGFN